MNEIQIKVLAIERDGSVPDMPRCATAGSAGLDIRAFIPAPVTIPPGGRAGIPTGLAFALPEGTLGLVFARSGLACKKGIGLSNGVGLIDSDYRGEVIVSLQNLSDAPFTVSPGDRIAQFLALPAPAMRLVPVHSLPESGRGEGGFGSTGVK